MTEMKPKEGRIIAGPSLRGSMGRSAAGHNGRVAKEKTSAVWQGGWMPENISGVPAGGSVFLLTSPLIGRARRSAAQWAAPRRAPTVEPLKKLRQQCGRGAGCRKIFLAFRQGEVFFS